MTTRSPGSTNRPAARALVGLLSLALLGLVPVALAGPAHAASQTRIVAKSAKKATYRDDFSANGNVQYHDGDSWEPVPQGQLVLERRKAGSTEWKPLETDDVPSSFYFYPVTAVGNATYRLVYEDSAGAYSSSSVTWQVKVYREMTSDVTNRLVFKGKVKPKWKRKPVIIQVKKASRWVRYDKVRTNRRSRWHKKIYARRSGDTKWRAYVEGTRQFQKSYTDTWRTYYLRSAPRVIAE